MSGELRLFDLNPALDRRQLARSFVSNRRVQVASLLTPASADTVYDVLARHTDWGLGWQSGSGPPGAVRGAVLRKMTAAARAALGVQAQTAAHAGKFAFVYARYPMLDAYREQWDPGHPLDLLLEHLNAEPMLELVRAVTAIPGLLKADAQATLYAPGHFLTSHDDSDIAEGRRVAYVLGMTRDWRPDWGGVLNFTGADGEITVSYRPQFNVLNLFLVPQMHHVSYVPPFAAVGRYAITGWFRDR